MAVTMRFDTLDYTRKLETAGVPTAQAEAQARVLADVLGDSVAFPGDLVALERNLSSKIEASELKIEGKLAAINGQITLHKWMLATSIGLSIAILVKMMTL